MAHLDCILCFQRQALQAARFVTDDPAVQERTLRRVVRELEGMGWGGNPAEMANTVHRIVREECGVVDPYREAKRLSNEAALALYPRLKEMVQAAEHPVNAALRLAIAGNIIDYGAKADFDLDETLSRALTVRMAVDDSARLIGALSRAASLLYLTDNAGEIVFDLVLLETVLERFGIERTILAVKAAPFINDATIEDARRVGLLELPGIELVEVGVGEPGGGIERDSEEFGDLLESVDVAISKGQSNYEALVARPGLFFLLIAKCPVAAEELGVQVGDYVLKGVER
jgi:uncharacterized protein with ATP-grasp and redox domains